MITLKNKTQKKNILSLRAFSKETFVNKPDKRINFSKSKITRIRLSLTN